MYSHVLLCVYVSVHVYICPCVYGCLYIQYTGEYFCIHACVGASTYSFPSQNLVAVNWAAEWCFRTEMGCGVRGDWLPSEQGWKRSQVTEALANSSLSFWLPSDWSFLGNSPISSFPVKWGKVKWYFYLCLNHKCPACFHDVQQQVQASVRLWMSHLALAETCCERGSTTGSAFSEMVSFSC